MDDRRLAGSRRLPKTEITCAKRMRTLTEMSIRAFYLLSDNSNEMPGKRDVIKFGKDNLKKHNLDDTLENMWKKYNAEYPN